MFLTLIISILINLFIFFIGTILLILSIFKTISFFTKTRCKSEAKLHGKVVLITGGNSGLGYETAKDLAKRGARVIIASRDEAKSARAVKNIIELSGNNNVEHRYLNLADFNSVKTFAEDFNKSYDRLDILVNNAGCAGLNHQLTKDGIDVLMQVNYFGPFLLTNLLKDILVASKPSRIVIVSSIAHQVAKLDVEDLKGLNDYHNITTYANSKLCNILWAKALAKKLPVEVTANALHPGVVETEIFNHIPPILRFIVKYFIGVVFKTAEEGAQTIIHLAVSENEEGKTGRYYSECARSTESESAKDDELIDQVWIKSLQITNSTF